MSTMTRGAKKQFDRDAVLDRAMLHFWTHGYERSGMAALLQSMGIGRQSLYDTFGDKRTLFLEALSLYFRSKVGPILATLRSPGSPLGNIRTVFVMWQKTAQESGNCGCLIGNSLAEFGEDDPELIATISGFFAALEDGFVHALERARDEGELNSPFASRDLARMLITTAQGMALMLRVSPDVSTPESVFRVLESLLGGAPAEG